MICSKSKILKIMKISRSSYYYSKREERNQRDIENEIIYDLILSIWQKSMKTYGYKRIYKKIRSMGLIVNIKRIRRLMKENKIYSIVIKRYKNLGKSITGIENIENKMKRDFRTTEKNQKWVSDITYIWSRRDGWCYMSSIMDLYSRRIIAHKVSKVMDVGLVLETLKQALESRGMTRGTLIHTDRESQYMSKEYRRYCKAMKYEISYSRKGNLYDNACIESFHATLKKEYVYLNSFENLEEIKIGVFKYVESWYNRKRIHSKLNYMSPVDYEEREIG